MPFRKSLLVVGNAALLGFALNLLFSGCAGSPSCADYGNCPESGGSSQSGGGSLNQGGNVAQSGHAPSDGAAGDVGGSGGATADEGSSGADANAGAAGAAGAEGKPPCNGACSGPTPVCDLAADECVQCVKRADCAAPKPVCDSTTRECVECVTAGDCPSSGKPFCDKATRQCVACLKQSDCVDPAASACKAGACSACSKDEECSNIAGKGVCDRGTCVQCTGKSFAACGQDAGTALVCDSLQKTCTSSKQASAGLCQSCVTDAQCKPGQMCVLQKFGASGKAVGYFCQWKKGDTANGAPTSCVASGRPYVGTQLNATSIDGAMSDICVLSVSTCAARNQFRSKDCSVAGTASDSACGVSPPGDAKCAAFDATNFRCTMTCLSDDDCPAPATCNTGQIPAVCNLN